MKRQAWVVGLRWTAWISGLAVAVLSLLLITDGMLEVRRAAVEKSAAAELEVRTPRQVEAVTELEKVTQLQTERSIGRKLENRQLGWALLVAAVLFLSSAKGYQSLMRGQPIKLVTLGRAPRDRSRESLAQRSKPFAVAEPDDAIDLSFVDQIVDSQGRSREMAIPILQAMQTRFRYLPEAGLRRVCETTEIGPSQIVGVASFYSQFRRDPVGRYLVRVCHGTACHVAGVGPIMDEMRRRLDIPPDADTDAARRFTLESVNCLGCCSLAPVMMVEDHVAGHLTPTGAWEELAAREVEA